MTRTIMAFLALFVAGIPALFLAPILGIAMIGFGAMGFSLCVCLIFLSTHEK